MDMYWKRQILTFIVAPEKSSCRTICDDIVKNEVEKVERQTGAKFCHLIYKTYSSPFEFRFVFDMGLQDSSFKNKMKMKMPNRVNQIFEDDSEYIMRLKQHYKDSKIFERDGYNIFLFNK